jgi:thiol-disulfide isomerase/thioredoxin
MNLTKKKHPSTYPNIIALFSLALGFISLTSCYYAPQLRTFPKPITAPIGSEEGKLLPDLVFKGESGKVEKLQQYRGRIVFINFWASWCPHCKSEMPSLQKLYDALKDDKRIAFLFFTAERDYDESKQWAKSNGYSIPMYRRSGGPGLEMTGGIPRTMILDQNGIIVK